MKKRLKPIPKFDNEQQEREFWQRVDSTEYVDYSHMENWRFPNLKLTSKPVTVRLPQGLIDRLKIKAHQMDIPYQALMKVYLTEKINDAA